MLVLVRVTLVLSQRAHAAESFPAVVTRMTTSAGNPAAVMNGRQMLTQVSLTCKVNDTLTLCTVGTVKGACPLVHKPRVLCQLGPRTKRLRTSETGVRALV